MFSPSSAVFKDEVKQGESSQESLPSFIVVNKKREVFDFLSANGESRPSFPEGSMSHRVSVSCTGSGRVGPVHSGFSSLSCLCLFVLVGVGLGLFRAVWCFFFWVSRFSGILDFRFLSRMSMDQKSSVYAASELD